MANQYQHNLTTLARRLRPLLLNAVRAAPGVAAVMLNRVILIPSGTGDPGIYDKSAAGLAAALSAAVSGDTVWLPPCALGGNQSVPAGVSLVGVSRGRCVIAGQVTIGAGSKIEHLSITWAGSVGVVGPSSGTGYVLSCDITVSQGGNATGVQGNDGKVEIWNSHVSGVSSGGDGYGALGGAGEMYMDGGWLEGSTAPAGALVPSDPIYPSYSVGNSFTTGALPNSWVKNLGVGGSPPAGWTALDWDAAGAGWVEPTTMVQGPYSSQPMIDGCEWISESIYPAPEHWGDVSAYRHQFLLDCAHVYGAVLDYWADDEFLALYVNGALVDGLYHNFWDTEGGATPHITVELNRDLFTPGVDNVIAILFMNGSHAEYGTTTALQFKLTIYTSGSGNLVTNGVRMDPPVGEPAQGDRAVWDATGYQARHANDIDEVTGIHHTLGTGAGQAAGGNHTHIVDNIQGLPVTTDPPSVGDALTWDGSLLVWQPAGGISDLDAVLIDDVYNIISDDNDNLLSGG